jgi:hypothetical protein
VLKRGVYRGWREAGTDPLKFGDPFDKEAVRWAEPVIGISTVDPGKVCVNASTENYTEFCKPDEIGPNIDKERALMAPGDFADAVPDLWQRNRNTKTIDEQTTWIRDRRRTCESMFDGLHTAAR